MAREAALFRVEGPRGIYYAVYEPETQVLFTEANEKGARDHAAEAGLTLSREQTIRHAELMRRTGRDAQHSHRMTESKSPKPEKPADAVIRPLVATLPKNTELSGNEIVSTRVMGGSNPFASSGAVSESAAPIEADLPPPDGIRPSDMLNRDFLNFSQAPRGGRRGNPFSGPSQK